MRWCCTSTEYWLKALRSDCTAYGLSPVGPQVHDQRGLQAKGLATLCAAEETLAVWTRWCWTRDLRALKAWRTRCTRRASRRCGPAGAGSSGSAARRPCRRRVAIYGFSLRVDALMVQEGGERCGRLATLAPHSYGFAPVYAVMLDEDGRRSLTTRPHSPQA